MEIKLDEEAKKKLDKLIKEMQPNVESIAIRLLFSRAINSLLKMLLLMRKTPYQAEAAINEVKEALGFKGDHLELFDHLTEEDKKKFNLAEPLSEANYLSLLQIVSQEFLKE